MKKSLRKYFIATILLSISACSNDILKLAQPSPEPTKYSSFIPFSEPQPVYYNNPTIAPTIAPTVAPNLNLNYLPGPTPYGSSEPNKNNYSPPRQERLILKSVNNASGIWLMKNDFGGDYYLYICQEDKKLIGFKSYIDVTDYRGSVDESYFNKIGIYNNAFVSIWDKNSISPAYIDFGIKDETAINGKMYYKDSTVDKSTFEGKRINKSLIIVNYSGDIIKECKSEGITDVYNIPTPSATPSGIISQSASDSGDCYVNGYTKSDGSYVYGYYRNCPGSVATAIPTTQPVPTATAYASSTGQCFVNSYTKDDGTYVNGYYRACPDPVASASSVSSSDSSSVDSGSSGDVYVHGYTRADGTYVAPYTRSRPGSTSSKSSSGRSSSGRR